MEATYNITEDNLIGSIASAMLKLKKIKEGFDTSESLSDLFNLIEFIEKASDDNSHNKLLFDKHFIITEPVLENLHREFKPTNDHTKIDFITLKKTMKNIDNETSLEEINSTMRVLKEIVDILLKVKSNKHTYL